MTKAVEEKQSETEKAMKNLERGWYNAITSTLDLDTQSFQLTQGGPRPIKDNQGVWELYNTIPAKSLSYRYHDSDASFYDSYKNVVMNLKIQNASAFKDELGDKFEAWQNFKLNHVDEILDKGRLNVFKRWAMVELSPGETQDAIHAFEQTMSGVVNDAIDKLNEHKQEGTPKYERSFDDLKSSLSDAPTHQLSYDSETDSSDTKHTWASGDVLGVLDFFEIGGGGSYEKLQKKAATSHVTVEATFDHVQTFTAKPGEWYSNDALSFAYNNKGDDVWHKHPSWSDYFSEHGTLQRKVPAIVAIEGLDAKITSSATYSEEEQKTIKETVEVGIWPFAFGTETYEKSSKSTFNDEGHLVHHVSTEKGQPMFLGAMVESMAEAMGH